ncbi:MAG: hypothetical protein Q8O67_21675 [Deltaproteobacteria bacterium]|nr:hypothetical protein [Deltaproteobacteria bacterium]
MKTSFVVVVVALILGTLGCKKEPAEQQIRALLEEGAAGINANDSGRALGVLDDTYLDGAGRKRDQMKQLAFIVMKRERVLVAMPEIAITVDGDDATALVTALTLLSPPEVMTVADLVPTNTNTMRVEVKLHATGGKWKITGIRGDGFGGPLE